MKRVVGMVVWRLETSTSPALLEFIYVVWEILNTNKRCSRGLLLINDTTHTRSTLSLNRGKLYLKDRVYVINNEHPLIFFLVWDFLFFDEKWLKVRFGKTYYIE